MSTHNLEKIFSPASVAVVGASAREGSVGQSILQNLLRGGFEGPIYPINPHYSRVGELACFPSLSRLPEAVDLAVIATPLQKVPEVMEECCRASIGAVVIVSAGGKEMGEEGRRIEGRIKAVADRGKVRIIGPNCLGVVSTQAKLNATFAARMPLPGQLAFISQSGAICTAILDLSLKEKNGFSYFVSVGTMLDVDFGDLINYIGNDPAVSSIALYIENLTHFRKFMSAARAVSRVKPIVALKAGRSPAGARAAASHTGALAGTDAVYDAAFERAGIVRVNTLQEFFDCAELMAKQPKPSGSGVAIITNAGGPGVMAADALAAYDLEPVPLSEEAIAQLNAVLPPYWSRGNPIDILGDASPERYGKVVEICLQQPQVSTLVVIMTPQAMSDPTGVAQTLRDLIKGANRSVFAVWMGGVDVERGREILKEAGIPTYETPERAVKAFRDMYCYARNLESLQQIPQRLPSDLHVEQDAAARIINEALEQGTTRLTEVESKALLSAYGIPANATRLASSPMEALEAARNLGYPVALKICSRDILHKTEAGAVLLNVRNDEELWQGFADIMQRASQHDPGAGLLGVSVQRMVLDVDCELIVGSKKDPDFGPVLLFGLGGILAEVLQDRALGLPPLNRVLARRMIEKTRAVRLLRGYRNRPPARMEQLEEILIRLAQLVADFPQIAELDINPLFVSHGEACAGDARVILEPTTVDPPMHLVISPYPGHLEMDIVTKSGLKIFVRPIKPEDAPLLDEFFHTLSPRTIYFRFFRPLKSLSYEMLARFTQIDYDRDVVLIALDQRGADGKILGVVRLMGDPDVTRAEFAVVIGDAWQGKGVGLALLENAIAIARRRGIQHVWGYVLPENTNMLALGRKLGFTVLRIPEGRGYELRIDLTAA